jgi:hexosaminidase
MTSWSTSGVYSTVFESEDEPIDLYAIRHVYPMAGFNMLVDYYLSALKGDKKQTNDEFIATYCAANYGMDNAKAMLLKKALFSTPYAIVADKVVSPKPMTVNQLLDSAQKALDILKSIQPVKGLQEFKHYLLMAKIRVYYLTFMKIESEVNAPGFTSTGVPVYVAQLKQLLSNEQKLNAEFALLNQDFLYPASITEENVLRSQKIHVLYDRLARIR